MFEWITNMEEESFTRVFPNRKGDLSYGDCWKYLTYSIESQVVVFGVKATVVESFLDKLLALGYWEKSVVEWILSKSSGWWEPVKITS